MAIQLSTTVRNARLDIIETTIGPAAQLMLFTGFPPGSCSSADTGTLVATFTLPSDWLADAANGSKVLSGSWQATASGSGTIGYFRIKDASGATTHLQGTVVLSGQTGDMIADNTNVASGQQITMPTFVLNEANS